MSQGNIAHAFSAFVEVAKTWEGFEKFIPNLEAHKAQYAAKVASTYSVNTREFGFNVLNHADFHLKNMLFKTDSNGAVGDFYIVSLKNLLFNLVFIFYHHVLDRLPNLQLFNASN